MEEGNTKKPARKKWWFCIVITLLVLSITSCGSNSESVSSQNNDITFKKEAKHIDFKALISNPDKYKGTKIIITGFVQNISLNDKDFDGSNVFFLDTTKNDNSPEMYIVATKKNIDGIKEGDNVKVYGTFVAYDGKEGELPFVAGMVMDKTK